MTDETLHPSERSDITPAVPLEISAELAAAVDELLQDFAEGAELETALVVERSGALVSGISSEAEVMVDIISALVAGASSAMNTLVTELGGSGNIESFHQSDERAVYLAEILDRFVLVGVSTVPVPVGVIREKARRIRPSLIELLHEIKTVAPVPPA
ncbi:MAG: roadblock/LC7 domain-containing protein, partial [Verrucomicrobiota bacterium]